jgi:hypothetical protein
MLKKIGFIPWTALLLIGLILTQQLGLDRTMGKIPSIVLLISSIVILIIEFFRSGDMRFHQYVVDTSFSLLVLIGGTWYLAYLFYSGIQIYMIDYIIYTILVVDSWLSPINAYRTALRNVQVGQ